MTGLPNTQNLPKEINVAAQGVVQVVWKQSIRAKRLSLRIAPYEHTLIVTVPIGCRSEQALAFVQANHAWINERLQKLEKPPSFSDNNIIPIQGKPYRIMHAPKQQGGAWLEAQYLMVSGDRAFINRRVADFLRSHATTALRQEVQAMAQSTDLHPSRVDIRDTSSRWGSCSSSGRIMLSWRVIMAPDIVRHYLIAHELSHLKHMNHGPLFWQQVAKITPFKQQAETCCARKAPSCCTPDKHPVCTTTEPC
ncbi:M48 family metallopeptidase [Acetobacter okinawensis]|uniref:M48 family metallopeptidase n=1 Tax=Acetobacter okinawensis TaxID=1076594 RepID=UPI001F59332E|nr:YgjP-like metallopeptidase domain-containing protein [Acetobacter okinawensis]